MKKIAASLACCVLGACSALVSPDTGKLGGHDSVQEPSGELDAGAMSGFDAGPEHDASEKPEPGCDTSCDDSIACTRDRCVNGACRHEADDGKCDSDQRCSAKKGCVSQRCHDASDCDDGNPCNGQEVCSPAGNGGGCSAGEPMACDDGVSCTKDSCDPGLGCQHQANDKACDDNVGCTVDSCDAKADCQHAPDDTRCAACFFNAHCDVTSDCTGGISNCSDGDLCTVDSCDIESGTCMHRPDPNGTLFCSNRPDTCDQAAILMLDDNGHAEVSGSFSELDANYDTGCGQVSGRDAVYQVTVDRVSDIFLDTLGSAARTVLAASPDACSADGFGWACTASVSTSQPGSRLLVHRYDPAELGKTLYILVDAADASVTGDYQLRVDVLPAADDGCDADVITLSDCATVIGFMQSKQPENAWGQLGGDCQPGGPGRRAPEAILNIPGADDGTVALSASSDEFGPALYARTVCDSDRNEDQLGCATTNNPMSGQANLTIHASADQRAFVVIDNGKDGARYTLRCVP
jgi:hypothetical protein